MKNRSEITKSRENIKIKHVEKYTQEKNLYRKGNKIWSIQMNNKVEYKQETCKEIKDGTFTLRRTCNVTLSEKKRTIILPLRLVL